MPRVDVVPVALLLARLATDPFSEWDTPSGTISRDNAFYDKFQPRRNFWDESKREYADKRIIEYDAPRIRFFRDRYRSGAHVEAIYIKVDPSGRLHMGNGYHRLCAAVLAQLGEVRVMLRTMNYDTVGCLRQIDKLRRELRKAA